MPLLIVINGPIGAGKSSLALALADEIRQQGRSAAVVELDLLYFMTSSGGPMRDPNVWLTARRAAAGLADSFLSSGVEAVIVKGGFWDKIRDPVRGSCVAERAAFLDNLAWSGEPYFVTLLISYDEAFRRVQGDPTRNSSRNPERLRKNHANFEAVLEPLKLTDLVLESTRQTPQRLATAILESVMTRSPASPSDPR